jgi:peptidoglycan/LPS O-acetylase OafA/YrhL
MVSQQKEPAHAPSPAKGRLSYLEGLRALAALWVVVSHLWIFEFGMFAHRGVMGRWTNWLLYSHLAVDLFIVLSGYCLTLPLTRDGELRGGIISFYKRRARRILPPCYIALLLSIGIGLLAQGAQTGKWSVDLPAIGWNFLLLQDINLRANIFDGPLWSIAVEWRIYLLFPFLAWVWQRYGTGVLLVTAGIGFGMTRLILTRDPDALMACPWYLLLFALGMCAAATTGKEKWKFAANSWRYTASFSLIAAAVLIIAYPITATDDTVFGAHMPIIDTFVGLFTASLLVGVSDSPKRQWARGRAMLSWSPFVKIGQFSYSLYLTHVPVLLLLVWLLLPRFTGPLAAPMAQFFVLLGIGSPIILIAAYLFHLVCERPFMNSRARAAPDELKHDMEHDKRLGAAATVQERELDPHRSGVVEVRG